MEEPELFRVRSVWSGDVEDYDTFSRELRSSLPGGQGMRTSSFKEGRVTGATNPEELFLASQSACLMLTYLAVCSKSRVPIVGYEDEAEALLEFVDRRYRVTKMVLRPTVKIKGPIDKSKLDTLFEKAHGNCYIALSVKSEVVVEPTYVSV
ncbi:OsmC family protein [candidate division KSB1 bacterium]|nr:OsmC family protein [candidate division KSB1 bacterium]